MASFISLFLINEIKLFFASDQFHFTFLFLISRQSERIPWEILNSMYVYIYIVHISFHPLFLKTIQVTRYLLKSPETQISKVLEYQSESGEGLSSTCLEYLSLQFSMDEFENQKLNWNVLYRYYVYVLDLRVIRPFQRASGFRLVCSS